jgi:putative DNA primase/helicase
MDGDNPEAIVRAVVDAAPEVVDARPPEFSDEALALLFARRHADDLRYVAVWGQWMLWAEPIWQADDTLRAFDLARAVCRSVSALAPADKRIGTGIASAKTVAATASLARADRRLAATVDGWDADEWLFVTPEGENGD